MNSSKRLLFLGAVLVITWTLTFAFAAEASSSDAASQSASADSQNARTLMELKQIPSEIESQYGESISFSFLVTPARDVMWREFSFVPLGRMADLYETGSGNCKPPGDSSEAGQTSRIDCSLKVSSSGIGWWESHTLRAGSRRFSFTVSFALNESRDDQTGDGVAHEKNDDLLSVLIVEREFSSGFFSVFLGGLSGAFLLALFLSLYDHLPAVGRRISESEGGEEPSGVKGFSGPRGFAIWSSLKDVGSFVFRVASLAIVGGICSILLVVLVESLGSASAPVAVEVRDFWGGLVVGFMAIPVARWLRSVAVGEARN